MGQLFIDLTDSGIYGNGINYHVEMLRVCFMLIIQHELNEMKKIRNTHYIREMRNWESPPGRSNILYFLPKLSGKRNCNFPINMNDFGVVMLSLSNHLQQAVHIMLLNLQDCLCMKVR